MPVGTSGCTHVCAFLRGSPPRVGRGVGCPPVGSGEKRAGSKVPRGGGAAHDATATMSPICNCPTRRHHDFGADAWHFASRKHIFRLSTGRRGGGCSSGGFINRGGGGGSHVHQADTGGGGNSVRGFFRRGKFRMGKIPHLPNLQSIGSKRDPGIAIPKRHTLQQSNHQ